MWSAKLLAAVLLASGVTANALLWKLPQKQSVNETTVSDINQIEKFIYPGAQVISSNQDSTVMIAEATLDDATAWYMNILETNRMKDRNIIRSDANGIKINLLIASGLPGEIDVAIKEETNGAVTIAVNNNTSDSLQI